jgi:HlyD family secretion protein
VRVPETQAKDILVGQRASIDTRGAVIKGRVARIDPSVQNGTVLVDVSLEGGLPPGARPDLTIEGTIEIERLSDVLFVGRPAFGNEQSTVQMFKLDADAEFASRIPVRLGRSSTNTVEISEGLAVGDRVILSDMSQWAESERIRIK